MALRLGTLVGFIRTDDSGMRRGLTDAELRMRGFQRGLDGRLRDMRGRFVSESEAMGRALGDAAGGGDRLGLSLGRLAGMARGVGGVAMSLGKVGAALGTAVPLAAGLAATLANVAPAAGIAATGVLSVGLAFGALKIGMMGVGDALKNAFDPDSAEAYAEALEKLSPSARRFVETVRGLGPQFDKLKLQVQNNLFSNLGKTLEQTAKAAGPDLSAALKGSAGALNRMGLQVLNVGTSMAKNGTLGKALDSATIGLHNLIPLPATIAQGLIQIGAAAGPSFERLTAAGGRAFEGLSAKMTKAFESGAMEDAIERAVDLLKQLGRIIGNVGAALGSLFTAADASGAGFLGTLESLTGALADAFASDEVQAGLRAIFSVMSTLAETAAPLLVSALKAIAPVFAALGPPVETLVEALGEALGPVIEALGPVLEAAAVALGAMVTAFAPLLPIIGELVAALLPALTPLLEGIGELFTMVAPLVEQLAGVLGEALMPVFAALVPVVEPIVQMLLTLAEAILPILTSLITELAPVVTSLAETFAELLVALAPVIADLGLLVADILVALTPVLIPIIELIAQLATLMADELAMVITTVVIPALNAVSALLRGDFSEAWEYAKEFVRGVVGTIARRVGELPGKVWDALSDLAGKLRDRMSDAGDRMKAAAGIKIAEVVTKVEALPGKAKAALGDLGSRLYSSGRSLLQGFIDGVKSKIQGIKDAVSDAVSAARDFFPFSPAKEGPFSGSGWTLHSGRSLVEGFREGIADQLPALRAQLDAMPSMRAMEMGVRPVPAGAYAGAGWHGAGPAVGGERPVTVVLDVRGGDDEFVRMIRKWAGREGGGNVQRAFGK